MARRRLLRFPDGSPQQELEDAVDRVYPDRGRFWADLAKRLNVTPATAKGAYYGALRSDRPLPDSHADAYVELLGVGRDLIAKATPPPARLERGRAEEERQELLRRLDDLERRLAKLEKPRRRGSGR